MNFTIDPNRLEGYRSRFKAASMTYSVAFDRDSKCYKELQRAQRNLADQTTARVRNRDMIEAAKAALGKATVDYEKASRALDEASRASSYHGALVGRCDDFAEKSAAVTAAARHAEFEDELVRQSSSALAAKSAPRVPVGRQNRETVP